MVRASKAAWARNAFHEALETCKQALALLNLLPESPERENRELELRMSIYNLLWLTRGPAERETIDATGHAATLAEKAGNLGRLVDWAVSKGYTAINCGDLPSAALACRPNARARSSGR